jgi:FMN phosphatase YigB (HAD superfamily)
MGTAKQDMIFISYSRYNEEFAKTFAIELRSAGFSIWLDQQDIRLGERWEEAVEEALRSCEILLLILTPASVSSENVKDEIGYAIDHGKRILPVLLEQCEVPLRVRRFQYLDVTKLETRDAIEAAKRRLEKLIKARFEFWEGLAEKVVIIFGAIENSEKDKDGHSMISLRDLKAAQTIEAFLHQRYPEKKVGVIAATIKGWQLFLPTDADLIIIGGWVVNREFRIHEPIEHNSLRLKLGRLCRVEGKHVYDVVVRNDALGSQQPIDLRDFVLSSQPQRLEELSSRLVVRDFGLISDKKEEIYGAKRRVISIAGIKGNGTLGAALHLTYDLNSELYGVSTFRKEKYDRLQLIIKTDIVDDVVTKTEIAEVIIDGSPATKSPPLYWRACELRHSCTGCKFGEPETKGNEVGVIPARQRRLESIIFDLDDTLVDTFSTLIIPLEIEAARNMIRVEHSLPNVDDLAALLLQLRKSNPANIEDEVQKQVYLSKEVLKEVFEARKTIVNDLGNIEIKRLVMNPQVKVLLRNLKSRYKLFLLTEGDSDFQRAKIDQLGIRDIFNDIVMISAEENSKESAISALMQLHKLRKNSTLIIGNRLDKEIRAGTQLGIKTVWIRWGEGSAMRSGNLNPVPDYILNSVLDIQETMGEMLPI